MATPSVAESISRARRIGSMWPPALKDDLLLTLDGDGTNKLAFTQAGWPLQNQITFEIDADVALCQTLAGFPNVRFTGSQHDFHKRSLVCGKNCTQPLIEHVLLKRGPGNLLLSENERSRVRLLYLDYCGGPVANQDPPKCRDAMEKAIAGLSNLRLFAITMSKRRHAELCIETYMRTPYGFALVETFTGNSKVVCWLFRRVDGVVLTLSIPHLWWNGCSRKDRFKLREGTVLSYDSERDRYRVWVHEIDGVVEMTQACVDAYRK